MTTNSDRPPSGAASSATPSAELTPARRLRVAEITDSEWEVVLGTVWDGGRGDELWSLALEAPPRWGARILKLLGDRGWHPAPADRRPYAALVASARACQHAPSLGPLIEPPLVTLEGHRWDYAVAITPDGSQLVTGGWDRLVRLWSVADGRPVATLEGHSGWVVALAVTPDGSLLVSGSTDRTVRLWSLPDGRPRATVEGHTGGVEALAVTPDGSLLAGGGTCEAVRLWSLPDGRPRVTLDGPAEGVNALAVTQNGALLVGGGVDSTVRLWSLPDGRPLATLEGHTDRVTALAVTPDGSLLASASYDSTVRLWSLPDGRPVATIEGHTSRVCALAITPDGSLLASGGWDRTLRLWSLPDGQPQSLVGQEGVFALAVTPDGSLLASVGVDTLRLWGSALNRLSRAPIATIGASDVGWLQELRQGNLAAGDRPWAELILGLLRFRSRLSPDGANAVATMAVGNVGIEMSS